jgi:hypothetical protein
MEIDYEIGNYKTKSGKASINFICKHCRSIYMPLCGFYYQADLDKKDLKKSLQIFVDKINSNDESLFKKKRTFYRLKSQLCDCNEKVIDFERIVRHQRAKEILRLGLMSMQDKKHSVKKSKTPRN